MKVTSHGIISLTYSERGQSSMESTVYISPWKTFHAKCTVDEILRLFYNPRVKSRL